VGTVFALVALWFAVSALALRAKRARMETASADARAAAEESRSWGFGDRFLLPLLKPNEAGVVARAAAEPGARAVAVLLGVDGRTSTLARPAARGRAPREYVGLKQGQPPPKWARLARKGGVLQASVSADGVNWFPARAQAPELPSKLLVGLVVTPATPEPCVATFRSVRLVPASADGWRDTGEGEAAEPPRSSVSGSSATVASGGAGAGAGDHASHFAYVEASGDFEITARVGEIDPAYVLPDPLAGGELARARLAVAADARASGVFAFFTAVLAALLWGLRRFDPSVRAEMSGRAGGRPG
jgi:hypothetical protein